MAGAALIGAFLAVSSFLAVADVAWAQDPDPGSQAATACEPETNECVAGVRSGDVRVVPSRPGELAEGHEDQSVPILVGLMLVAFGGLVVAVLNRLALDEE